MAGRRTALWRAVKQAQPALQDHEVGALLARAAAQERDLVLNGKLTLEQAREIANRELFPENLDPFQGDAAYGRNR